MALTTLFDVKKYGSYEYIEATAPTTAEKEPAYLNGEEWLDSSTGLSYELTDQVAGTWTRNNKALDAKINTLLEGVEKAAFAYLKTVFSLGRAMPYTGDFYGFWNREDVLLFLRAECIFSDYTFDSGAGTINPTTKAYGGPTDWAVGDIVRVLGSKRNDAFLTLTAINESTGVLTVSETLKDEVSEGCFVFLCDIPSAVIDTIGRMVYFDSAERNAIGLKSEKVGTYSWTRDDVRIGGLGYPDEIIGNLDQFAGVALGGLADNPLEGIDRGYF